jgi:LPXTG-motif cell wall-anchored protein
MILNRCLAVFNFFIIAVSQVMAQGASAASDSPYSDQRFITPDQPAWYEAPVLWIGLALLILTLVVLYIRKKRERYT